ncbi:MAG: sugar phosphate isomerase/epimerase [Proteobacteria bacterium]|nr:sugar phosphate isomerase/epimerase [Pseudomonadota bacterium]
MISLAARARGLTEGGACADLGFQTLEITLPCPGGPEEEAGWAAMASTRGLTLLAHGPQEGNPFDIEHLENEYLPALERGLEAAARLKVPAMTVHFWLDSRWIKPPKVDPRAKIALLSRVAERSTDLGVSVNLENLSEPWRDFQAPLAAIPGLGLTLDVGHGQLLADENEAPGIIDHWFDRLRHLHLHDNHGGRTAKDDLHLIPGRGRVPWDAILSRLKARNYRGTATLELQPLEMEAGRRFVTAVWERV